MARITAEDCILKVPNRFELIMYASQRARAISAGAALTLDRDNDKNPVVALREIAESTVETSELEDSLIKTMQKHVEMDEPDEDEMDILAIQQELLGEGVEVEAAPSVESSDDGADETKNDDGSTESPDGVTDDAGPDEKEE